MYTTDFWTLWEKARVGWSKRTATKHVYYQVWKRSPLQVGCMRQVLRAGALGWPRGMEWGRRWEGGSGWGTHINPWLIHVNVWQKPLQYCKVISLQLIKINEKKKKTTYCPRALTVSLENSAHITVPLTAAFLDVYPISSAVASTQILFLLRFLCNFYMTSTT